MSDELEGLRIVSFESRKSSDIARMLEGYGATALQAPSMQEVPLENNDDALAFGERLMSGDVQGLVLMTGVGTRILVEALSTRWPQDEILSALGKTTLISRGPKPVAALKAFNLKPQWVAPEPNTWEEVLALSEGERSQLIYKGKPFPFPRPPKSSRCPSVSQDTLQHDGVRHHGDKREHPGYGVHVETLQKRPRSAAEPSGRSSGSE